MQYHRIVLNEPHASIEGLYDDELSFWKIDERFINDIVMKWTDWHTDFLFHGYQDEKIKTIRFPFSRFIVDAERLWDDPLEEKGQGIIYKQMEGYTRCVPLKSELHLLKLWQWHQNRLKNSLCEGALLLDCHSFPSEMGDVDICIGYNEDWSKPHKDTIELAVNLFEENGYKVGINYPYSNSETPSCPFLYQSMMLEINKKVYMEESTLRLKTKRDYRTCINLLTSTLLSSLLTTSL